MLGVLAGIEHFASVRQCTVGEFDAAEHTGQFAYAPGIVEQCHVRQCGVALGALLDMQVVVRLGRDLRQVRHGQYLPLGTEAP